jgi:L-malate glycosyltransferase
MDVTGKLEKKLTVLWVVNILFGKMLTLIGKAEEENSGSWLGASLQLFYNQHQVEVIIITTAAVNTTLTLKDNNITYCILPGGYPPDYNHLKLSNINSWKKLQEQYNPSVVQIWGTEFSHSINALQAFGNSKVVVYMQGVLRSIARYYTAGLSNTEIKQNITLRDIIKRDGINDRKRKYFKQAKNEAYILQKAKNVIVENNWCAAYCQSIAPAIKIHKCALTIKEVFFEQNWSKEKTTPFSILSPAASYPIKGLHILLKAMAIVAKQYPQVKLFIPGLSIDINEKGLKRWKQNGYTRLTISLIKQLNLQKHVGFLGSLTASKMAEQMASTNIFVMPSSIENHSSTLIEAMIVGAPCIASYVGGIPEYIEHGKNGLLYRFEEYEVLAQHICTLLNDNNLAAQFGTAAAAQMRSSRQSKLLKNQLLDIYNNLA